MELIDAQWIRRHLTGRHGELKALADATQLSPDKITKILKGERQIKSYEVPRFVAFFQQDGGFAENGTSYTSQARPMNATARLQSVAAALCPALFRPEVYRVQLSAMAAGLLAGDILVVELGMTAKPGDLVIATMADTDHDTQSTLIRRYWPPLLVPVTAEDPYPAMPAEGTQSAAVVASVKAVARGGML